MNQDWTAPELVAELDMNSEIGSYQQDDDRDTQEPIVDRDTE
jgi:hypothetical protein